VASVAGLADHREHRGVLGRGHRRTAETREADRVAGLASSSAGRDVYRREHRILRRIAGIENRRSGIRCAVTGDATCGDAGVQDRVRRQRCGRIVRGCLRMTDRAGLVGRIRHVARRQYR